MTEQVPPTSPEGTEPAEATSYAEREATTTGVPAVDEVLADLDRLDGAPLKEHLEAYERAHESLRAALDAPSVDEPGNPV